ncbi:MAG: cytochrome c biogenesis protein ResB, partial [Bacteroidales bacterium]
MSLIKRILYSHTTTNIYLLILAVLFGAATFIEKFYSTQTAKTVIYNNPIVYVLLFFGLIHFSAIAIKGNFIRTKRMGMFLFHASFLFILLGAFITNIFGFEGYMHIREGLSSNQMIITAENNLVKQTPFEVLLKEFKIQRYPGSKRASSYESILQISHSGIQTTETISVNKVVHIDGYRLYQSSFDQDEKGTVLLVNYDPVGMIVSYLGYIILFLSILWILFSSHSLLGRLRKELSQMPKTIALLLLFGVSGSAFAFDLDQKYMIPQEHAALFGKLSIQSNSGRIEPFNTYSSKIYRKITGETKNSARISDSFVLSLILYPDYWNDQPVIQVKSNEINTLLNQSGNYVSFNALFDQDGNYILDSYVKEITHKSAKELNGLEKAILKLDEKANIIFGLQTGNFTPLFPQPGNKENKWFSPDDDLSGFTGKDSLFVSKIFMWYLEAADKGIREKDWAEADKIVSMISTFQQAKSPDLVLDPQKVDLEILYNKLDIFNRAAIAYLALSTLLLLTIFISIVYGRSSLKPLIRVLVTLLIGVFALHATAIGVRWYISGQAPWSNSYESLVYAAWCVVLAGIVLSRRSLLILALSSFFTGFILLVCRISAMDPEITPLV